MSFHLKKEIEKYVSFITSDIMSSKTKKKIQQEYTDHIEDLILQYNLGGLDEREAFLKACEDMGDVKKARFLLAEIHNNKLQSFIVSKVLKPLKTFFTSKNFFKFTLIALITFVLITVICIANFPFVLDFVSRYVLLAHNQRVQSQTIWIIFIACILFLCILLGRTILSTIGYFLGKIKLYCHLCIFSLFQGYKLKFLRIPFASLRGLNKSGDIKINVGSKTYRIHFLDVVMKYRRSVTILNHESYTISKVLPDELRTYGAALIDGKSIFHLYVSAVKNHAFWGDKFKKIPQVDISDNDIHIIIIHQNPVSKDFLKKNTIVSLSDGDYIGNYIYCTNKFLIRRLKREK